MGFFTKIKSLLETYPVRPAFNQLGVPENRMFPAHIVKSTNYCRTHSFEQKDELASLQSMLQQQSRLYLEAKQDAANPALWGIRRVNEFLADGEWVADQGDFTPVYNKSFDEVANTMAIFEKHQKEFMANTGVPLPSHLESGWFSTVAKDEGYFEDVQGRFSRPDQNGDLAGVFQQRELDRLKAQQNGVFQTLFGQGDGKSSPLKNNLKMLEIVMTLQEKIFDPLSKIDGSTFTAGDTKMDANASYGIFRRKSGHLLGYNAPGYTYDRCIIANEDIFLDRFNTLFSTVEKNEGKFLTPEDQYKFCQMIGLVAVEKIVAISQKLYQENLQNPSLRTTVSIQTFNKAIEDIKEKYFKDVSPALMEKIENDIINGTVKEGPGIQERIGQQFQSWRSKHLETVRENKTSASLQLGHLANTARLTSM